MNNVSTGRRFADHVAGAPGVVFGNVTMTPAMRTRRTLYIVVLAFLIWNGSPFHIVGLFGWTMSALVAPLLSWPAGSAWWATTQQMLAGTNSLVAFGGLAILVLAVHLLLRGARWLGGWLKSLFGLLLWAAALGAVTGFPFGNLGDMLTAANIPFAIGLLVWLFVLSYLLAELIRLWRLSIKDLDSDLGQILFRTVTRTVIPEAIIVLVLFWVSAKFDVSFGENFFYQVVAWGWQIPLGYFVGIGLNWLIEQRERAGLMPTKEQRPEHLATVFDGGTDTDTDMDDHGPATDDHHS